MIKKDIIKAYLSHAPISLCIREINRYIYLDEMLSRKKYQCVLDLGCGDGFWWTIGSKPPRLLGVDINKKEVHQAERIFNKVECKDASVNPLYVEEPIDLIICNCSLEHIYNIDGVFANLHSHPGDKIDLLIFVPSPNWAYQGSLQNFLMRHMPRIAMMISGALNGFFQHWHLYDYKIWHHILERNGWEVKSSSGLGGKRSEFVFRLFLLPGFLSFIFKSIFSVYANVFFKWLPFTGFFSQKILNWALENPLVAVDHPFIYEYVIYAQKKK